jgi:hypothetical protein
MLPDHMKMVVFSLQRATGRFALVLGLMLAPAPAIVEAQVQTVVPVSVGSEAERYLRVLETAGDLPLQPWSVRPISPSEL